MATGTRKPPKKKKAAKKTTKKKGGKKRKSSGKFKVGAAVVKAVKYIAAGGGVVAASVAANSVIESKSGKPMHPAIRAGVSLAAALTAAFVAVKLKKPAIAATIVTVGTVKAGMDVMPVFEDAGQKIADKAQKSLPSGTDGTEAAGGISRRKPSGSRWNRSLV